MPSQSLRKSGQFGLPFRKCFPTGQEVLSRNPFVNQVNSDIKCNTLKETLEHGRNPFVNQVNSDNEAMNQWLNNTIYWVAIPS